MTGFAWRGLVKREARVPSLPFHPFTQKTSSLEGTTKEWRSKLIGMKFLFRSFINFQSIQIAVLSIPKTFLFDLGLWINRLLRYRSQWRTSPRIATKHKWGCFAEACNDKLTLRNATMGKRGCFATARNDVGVTKQTHGTEISFHWGLCKLTKSSFFWREPPFNCFSRLMAIRMLSNTS